ncbi:hypothetical protein DFJ58DRAFT_849345 [Suillus subalutaceus]|uniref:uncharacterized protein n=1 Tax=Suillus subalutaceus TaxID=48586 RepID=UPI001B86C8D7|nr:uncharacterized protein DFJ58DRAFT_849345 [Suillus subalutaceus]KAG1827738.1 hypothetical protein DFJ58DRAFT_849345 [Suillus subalutaceus]
MFAAGTQAQVQNSEGLSLPAYQCAATTRHKRPSVVAQPIQHDGRTYARAYSTACTRLLSRYMAILKLVKDSVDGTISHGWCGCSITSHGVPTTVKRQAICIGIFHRLITLATMCKNQLHPLLQELAIGTGGKKKCGFGSSVGVGSDLSGDTACDRSCLQKKKKISIRAQEYDPEEKGAEMVERFLLV